MIIHQLKLIKIMVDSELKNSNSCWTKPQLSVVQNEIDDLLFHFEKNEKYFKYGKKQRMLQSTYILTDSLRDLSDTTLGKEITKLQIMYNNL